jgi:hypothetical protein
MQAATLPGLDLTLLIKNALNRYDDIDEKDELWDWDVTFNQVCREIKADI